MIEPRRYTSGAIALANLCATIHALESRRAGSPTFDELVTLSRLLFVRGDVLGCIADHDRAETVAHEAAAMRNDTAEALHLSAQLAARFHLFAEAGPLLDQALALGHPQDEIDAERAALLQAIGRYDEALVIRQRLVEQRPGIQSLGALASLLAEMGEWQAAEHTYAAALEADDGVSPIPAAQLLFEWGVSAMRRTEFARAEEVLGQLAVILPAHVPGRGHRAEVAIARGELDKAMALIAPLVQTCDDPEYRAIYAEILAARDDAMAEDEAKRAAQAYEALLARRPEAYADHAAAFFLSVGKRPHRALELAVVNWQLRDTPRSRRLLLNAQAASAQAECRPC